jgi:hypothetical protein
MGEKLRSACDGILQILSCLGHQIGAGLSLGETPR